MGNFGAVIATTPLAWTAATWGWRKTFFLIGGITLGLAFVTLLFTRDYARPSEPVQVNPASASGSNPGSRAKVAKVLASGRFWIIAMIFFGIYGTLIVILIVYTLTWVGIIFFFSQLGTAGLSMMLLVMGIATGGFISTLWGIVQDITPSEILGLISGMLNPAPFLGVAVFQVLTGAILDRTSRVGDLYPLSGFRNAFLICLFGIVICLVLSFFLPRSKRPEAS